MFLILKKPYLKSSVCSVLSPMWFLEPYNFAVTQRPPLRSYYNTHTTQNKGHTVYISPIELGLPVVKSRLKTAGRLLKKKKKRENENTRGILLCTLWLGKTCYSLFAVVYKMESSVRTFEMFCIQQSNKKHKSNANILMATN